MPRKNLDEHFEEERPEWTKRKHDLLARYVVPASRKMRKCGGAVALIDGYAGANAYGAEATGSTVIMVGAAKQIRLKGGEVNVYACEPDSGRYEAMCSNLADEISIGLLKAYNEPHMTALPKIQSEIGAKPAVVFLDPQTVTQMTLESDVLPWVDRAKTDILGVFMAGQACRCCAQVVKGGMTQKVPPEAYLGSTWQKGTTEDGAFNSFFDALGERKRFKGMYRLRKLEQLRVAYGIFGLSDHADGIWLLSNAVAKDYGLLKDFDYQKEKETSLFADDERESRQRASFERLVKIAETTIRQNPSLRGADLASHLFNHGIGINELFGNYEERDFTTAVYHVLGLPGRRPHAQA
ncbi:three-Cys-motif partner protein TcmP [Kamptonema cortianum]|nr:three-Cys-motif partner protein TcmP [Geitlerinema splendidum]MDK3158661.1 three-Cys-motif partner protein TcmP [Kamptonema cortianum]